MLAALCVLLAIASPAQTRTKAKAKTSPKPAVTQQDQLEQILKSADRFAYEGKIAPARAEYERALRAGGDAMLRSNADRSRNLGLAYLNGTPQNLNAAYDWLSVAHRLRPQDEDVELYLAQAAAWSGRSDEAAQHYRALAQKHPSNQDYVIGLAHALFRKGDQPGALQALESYLQTSPSRTEVRLQYALFLAYSKKYPESLSQYQAILQAEPDNLAARTGIAKVSSWQGFNDVAVDQFDKVLQRKPNYPDALIGKAFALMWGGRNNEARQLFTQLRDRFPNDPDIRTALKQIGPAPAPKPAPEPVVAKAEAPAKPAETQTAAAQPEPAPAVEQPEPPAPAIPQPTAEELRANKIESLLREAEDASAKQNFTEAVHDYHEALALDPQNSGIRLQIARVLSWAKSYPDSVKSYDQLLQMDPKNLNARVERARVLSWSKEYASALQGYEEALQHISDCSGADCPNERAVRMEYARVLGWSRRYDDALKQYAILLPPDRPLTSDDRETATEYARVLSWSRHYPESIAAYDRAIALGGDTFDARLGRAQSIYWSGRIRESALLMRSLEMERPKDATVSLALAGVEHNLGYNARALSLLNNVPTGSEKDDVRRSIRDQMRPVVRFRYGFENDREIASLTSAANDTGIKVLRYTAGVEFNIHPDVRMDVATTFTNGLTSNPLLAKHNADGFAYETMAHLTYRVTPWLLLIGGAGTGSTGGYVLQAEAPRQQHFVYDFHPVVTAGDWRFDFSIGRHIAEYTPLAIHDNVVQTRFTTSANYLWKKRHRFGVEYWHGLYTADSPEPGFPQEFTTEGNGGTIFVMPAWYKDDRVTFEAGLKYDSFGFDEGASRIADPVSGIGSAGFFTPRVYQRYYGAAHVAWNATSKLFIDANVTYGPQRLFGFASLNPLPPTWGNTGSFGTEWSYRIKDFRLSFAYDFFNTETPVSPGQTSGAYRSHVFTVGLSKRF